jgi:hypothetical protein
VPRRGRTGLGGSGASGTLVEIGGGTAVEGSTSMFGGSGSVGASCGGAVRGCTGGGVKARGLFLNQHELVVKESPSTTCNSRELCMAYHGRELKTKSSSAAVFAGEVDSTIMQLHSPVRHR